MDPAIRATRHDALAIRIKGNLLHLVGVPQPSRSQTDYYAVRQRIAVTVGARGFFCFPLVASRRELSDSNRGR